MRKYYNKEIPTEINVVYGGRRFGKTYYEFNKIKEENERLKEENIKLNVKLLDFHSVFCDKQHTINDLRDRINKAIELLEREKRFERLFSGVDGKSFAEQTIDILKGEENE